MTETSGLAKKRFRRTYGDSLIDLDEDGKLDLLVTSDFAGIDIHRGDGQGHFSDVTDDTLSERHTFGMSHTFADYDLDGKLDFYVIGMSSTTARRLEFMGLGREDRKDIQQMRSRMGYGNRMYLARGRRFEQPAFNDQGEQNGTGCVGVSRGKVANERVVRGKT